MQHHLEGEEEPPTLAGTWDLPHIGFRHGALNKGGEAFAMIDAQTIAISPRYGSPGLSIAYLDLKKTPITLAAGTFPKLETGIDGPTVRTSASDYRSPILLNEQYLAATSTEEGCIRLWDLQKYTSQVVYDFRRKRMRNNLCLIDDTTVACCAVDVYAKIQYSIYVLDTSTEIWSVKSVIYRKCPPSLLFDMCYVNTSDGTPCLVLCFPVDHCMQLVEMVSGKTRWNKEDWGKDFGPSSVCKSDTDSGVIYVAVSFSKILSIAVDDGTVLRSVNLEPYGITKLFCVRCYDKDIYVAHEEWRGQITTGPLVLPAKPITSISKFVKMSKRVVD